MFPMFDRRRTRLEKLFDEIEEVDDVVLKNVMQRADAEEISVALAIFSIERAGRVLAGLSPERLGDAMALLRFGSKPHERAVVRLAAEISRVRSGGVGEGPSVAAVTNDATLKPQDPKSVPLVVKAMDVAGRVLGSFEKK